MIGEVMLHNILNDMVGTSDPQRNEDVNEEKNIWKKEKVKWITEPVKQEKQNDNLIYVNNQFMGIYRFRMGICR